MEMSDVTTTEVVAVAARTSTLTGAAVDLVDYDRNVLLTLVSEIGSGTTPTLDGKVQDSADGSTGWADVTGATWTQITDAADAHETITYNVDENKRYIRVVGTIGGTTPSFAFGVTMAGMKKSH